MPKEKARLPLCTENGLSQFGLRQPVAAGTQRLSGIFAKFYLCLSVNPHFVAGSRYPNEPLSDVSSSRPIF
ncbi:MAG: hypothetical protein ABSF90_03505 [Syntrophobacteraceae bacterium]|jgi:hypothetical protein